MTNASIKLFQSAAVLAGLVLCLGIHLFIFRGAMPVWGFCLTTATLAILCAVFAYRTVICCARLKREDESPN